MAKSEVLKQSPDLRELPPAAPLNEAVWQAWVLKGRAQEQRSYNARIKAVKWMSLAGLAVAAAAGLWTDVTEYEVVLRFLVGAGALALMSQAFHARHYAFGIVFGALALLYNPVAPVFSFSGDWQRVLLVVTALPFVASLTSRNPKLAPNV